MEYQYVRSLMRLQKEREPERYPRLKKVFAWFLLLGFLAAGFIS